MDRPILFVSSSPYGLLNPALVLAGEVARRGGQDVYFATDEHRRADVEKVPGLRFVSLGDPIPENSPAQFSDDMYRKTTQRGRFRALRATVLHTYDPTLSITKYEQLASVVTSLKPALMVSDNDFASYAIRCAITLKIPYVLSSPYMPSYILNRYLPPGYPGPFSGLSARMTPREKFVNWAFFKPRVVHPLLLSWDIVQKWRRFFKICNRLGIALDDRINPTLVNKSAMILCYTVDGLDYPFKHLDKLHMVGPMIPPLPEAPPGELGAWLDAQDSVVYIGLGTLTRLTRSQIAAFVDVVRKLDGTHSVLWKLPVDQQKLLPPTLPGNLRIESWLPSQLDVLAHPNVRVFVNHGGANSFHEGLYFGKPQLIRPLWADCYDIAVRAQDAGIALTTDSHTTDIEEIVAKLTRLLTEQRFHERAAQFRAALLNAGGKENAADKILAMPALQD